ncbi:MAG: class E sortase [Rubrobacteraceae bacterium]
MWRFFGNRGNVGLYSLGVLALLALGASVFFGVGLLSPGETQVERASTPTVEKQEAPKDGNKEEDAKKEENKEETQEDQVAADQYEEPEVVEEVAEEPASEEEAPELAAAPSDNTLYLTVPKIGRYDDLVLNDMSEATLDQGAGKLPSSGFPWEPGSNTYIAAHVLGWEGTNSWQQFANLPNMVQGDLIYLTDSAGTTYTYEVTEILNVTPYDVWVTAPEPGRDMVSLQTCVGENYEQRLIVRGDRVS